MRLIINEDNSHFYYQKPGEAVKNAEGFINQYIDTGVTDLFFNVNCQRASYDSKVFEPVWKGTNINESYDGGELYPMSDFTQNAEQLNGKGRNVYTDWIIMCRKNKISPWISMRMNDIHSVHDENHTLHSDFWKNHPERRRVNYRNTNKWTDKALDFAREDVRSRALAFINEIAEIYDLDGLELDWMRFGFHFKPGFEREGVLIINQFTREVRNILNKAEQKRDHKINLAVRVPPRPETALGLGYDPVAWACEDLIDLFIITPFLHADTDMPVEIWRRMLRGTKTKIAVGIETGLLPYRGAEILINDWETVRGMAWSYIHKKADAVYLFNYMHSGIPFEDRGECELQRDNAKYRECLKEISGKSKLEGKNRRHIVSQPDIWAPGEPKSYSLPVDLGGWVEIRIYTGEAPKNQEAYVIISVKNGEAPEIYINGAKCEKAEYRVNTQPVPYDNQHSYKIPSAALHDGHNLKIGRAHV